jgi:MFS family permease
VLVLARELRHVPAKLLVLMLTAFIDMAGLFMVVPLIPFYVARLGAGGTTVFGFTIGEGQLVGIVVTAFTVAQLISAPFWGRVSDRFGRRPVMLVALVASAFAYLLFGFADSLWLLLLSRVVQGAGGGTVGVIQAYVSDAVEPAQRARALGWLSASTNLGVAFGPVIGSQAVGLADIDLLPGDSTATLGSAAPGVLAALLCLLNAVFAAIYLQETRERQAKDRVRPSVAAAFRQIVTRPSLPTSRLVLIYAIAIGSAHGVYPLMALFLKERFEVTENQIGYVYFYIGSLSVFARVLVLGRMVDRFGEVRVSRVGICSLVAACFLMPAAGSLGTLAAAIAFLPVGMALTFPCLTALLSRLVPQADRGMYLGVQQSFAGAMRVMTPLVYGLAFDRLGISSHFVIAGSMVFLTLLIGIGLRRATAEPSAG